MGSWRYVTLRAHYQNNTFRFECSTNIEQSLQGLENIMRRSLAFSKWNCRGLIAQQIRMREISIEKRGNEYYIIYWSELEQRFIEIEKEE